MDGLSAAFEEDKRRIYVGGRGGCDVLPAVGEGHGPTSYYSRGVVVVVVVSTRETGQGVRATRRQ